MKSTRRRILISAFLGIAGLAPRAAASAFAQDQEKTPVKPENKQDKPEEEVGATEDMMREHGVLNRVILIYEEGLRRLRDREEVTPELFHRSATLVRKFVEDYHEKLEEKFIFPEFEKAKKLTDLVKILKEQHEAGRSVTDVILRSATGDQFGKADARQELVRATQAFIRMYRPHEAREDTVLFPAFRKIVTAKQMKDLGEQFEKEEDRLFGEEGFEKTVDQVAVIEKQLGIYDLAKFTAKLSGK
jgi:hemerythrin-like domain-containing protein